MYSPHKGEHDPTQTHLKGHVGSIKESHID